MSNRLAAETSPYLLQHAENPVGWYPWGDKAFEEARRTDRPVHLSIGYAACHWCHVMAHESFEDPDVAAYMNEHFVNVKVDREERPDVDAVYMSAIQAMSGQGGWPMTVFCDPEGVPFLGGTYFPPEDRHGMPSWRTVLERVHELWETRRDDLLAQGNELVRRIEGATPKASKEPLGGSLLSAASHAISRNHDADNGGFGAAPKFPQPCVLEFLLRADARNGRHREQLVRTLDAMALGGIYDQLGGGFHRYTVDAGWLVPHFEKMLYDNAQLARVYTHAWQAYGDPRYRRIATETLEYLLRDMRDASGGLHSSEDADSEGQEGKFYVWSHEEFTAVAPGAADHYRVTPEGNWEGTNILTASDREPPAEARRRLLEARDGRVRPGKDDKVLASWNGLAIAALAEAGAAFGRDDLLDAAREAATFVLEEMRDPGEGLLHTYRDGRAKIPALLEDHAYLADGLVELWQATFEGRWLAEARTLATDAVDRFGDPEGGFYTVSEEQDRLVVRQKEIAESATPAPGGVLAGVLLRLAVLFDRPELRTTATDALRVARIYMDRAPQAASTWLSALDFHLATPKEIALTGDLSSETGRALREVVVGRFLPNRVLAARTADDGVVDEVALLRDKPSDGEATAYVCERYVCQRPTSDPEELASQLAERPGRGG